MKRRSFLAISASLPLLGNVPPYFPAPRTPKIISFTCTTNFELSQYLGGKLDVSEDIDEPPKIELSVSYDDGSVRNFTCDNKKWHYETRNHEHDLIIDGDTITYYCPMDVTDESSKLTCVCVFKKVKEIFNGV